MSRYFKWKRVSFTLVSYLKYVNSSLIQTSLYQNVIWLIKYQKTALGYYILFWLRKADT